jgi:hypothetical protein
LCFWRSFAQCRRIAAACGALPFAAMRDDLGASVPLWRKSWTRLQRDGDHFRVFCGFSVDRRVGPRTKKSGRVSSADARQLANSSRGPQARALETPVRKRRVGSTEPGGPPGRGPNVDDLEQSVRQIARRVSVRIRPKNAGAAAAAAREAE